jgi:hypothetical protein
MPSLPEVMRFWIFRPMVARSVPVAGFCSSREHRPESRRNCPFTPGCNLRAADLLEKIRIEIIIQKRP